MSQKTLVSILVVGLVILGGYFAYRYNDKKTDNKGFQSETGVPNEQTGKKMAFNEFIKQGGSYKCEVKQALSDMENFGTVYTSGDKIRGDYNTIAEGRSISTSFILRDGYSFTWSSDFPKMGFKVEIPQGSEGDTNTNMSSTYIWGAEQVGDYNCELWEADPSMFSLPKEVTFTAVDTK